MEFEIRTRLGPKRAAMLCSTIIVVSAVQETRDGGIERNEGPDMHGPSWGYLEDLSTDFDIVSDVIVPSKVSVLGAVRLIAIPPQETTARDLIDLCKAAEQGGASAVQVRRKDTCAAELLRITEVLLSQLTIPIFVNDRVDVARLAGAAGAHIGADDLKPQTIRAVLPRPFCVGVSVGNDPEAEAARLADVDYWSIGPFGSTPTKSDAGPALGVDGYRRLAALRAPGLPVVAIGGIHIENVADVVLAGADGIAVVGAIFGRKDVESATRLLRAALDAA